MNDKVVIALVAKYTGEGKFDSRDYIVYAENAQALSKEGKDFASAFKDKYGSCELTQVISFVSRDPKFSLDYQVGNGSETSGKNFNVNNKDTFWNNPVTGGVDKAREYCSGKTDAKRKALTLDDLKDELDPKKNSFNFCKLPSPKKVVKTMFLDKKPCANYPSVSVEIDNESTAEAIIENPAGKYVYAVLVEQLTSMAKSEIRDIKEYGLVSKKEADKDHKLYTYSDEEGFHFYYNTRIAVEGTGKDFDTKARIDKNDSSTTIRGNGKVLWIVTSDKDLSKKNGDKLDLSVNQVSPADFTTDYANSGMCSYRWCNEIAGCEAEDKNIYCKYNKNKDYITGKSTSEDETEYYQATAVPNGKGGYYYLRKNTDKVSGEPLNTLLEKNDLIPECTPMGIHTDDNVKEIYLINSYDPAPDWEGKPDKENAKNKYSDFDKLNKYRDIIRKGLDNNQDPNNGIEGILPILKENRGSEYCVYDNKAYKCEIVNDLYIRTEEKAEQGVDVANLPECTPVAWYQKDDNSNFTVYKLTPKDAAMVPALPLSVRSTNAKGVEDVSDVNDDTFDVKKLTPKAQDYDFFNTLKEQGNDRPTMFELFPQITSQPTLEKIAKTIMEDCTIQYNPSYLNNHIETNDPDMVSELIDKINTCFKKVEDLGNTQIDTRKLYFYGYASEKGNDTCRTNGDDKHACNQALSEDRNLYLIQQVVDGLSGKYNIKVENIDFFANSNGFTDTKIGDLDVEGPRYRFDHELSSFENTSKPDFTLVSQPCGSYGAEGGNDRYVFVSLIGGIGYSACRNRLTDKNVSTYLEEFIKPYKNNFKLQNKGIDLSKLTSKPIIKLKEKGPQEEDGESVKPDLNSLSEEELLATAKDFARTCCTLEDAEEVRNIIAAINNKTGTYGGFVNTNERNMNKAALKKKIQELEKYLSSSEE